MNLKIYSNLTTQIEKLKLKRDAIIMAHNYQLPQVQDIADFTGDSLELARKAKEIRSKVIVFCAVNFMAETAAILSPDKTIILPDKNAGCPMADMATADSVIMLRNKYPDAVVVCYINSTASVKAVSDVCCTSANAAKVVSRIPPNREIIFVPDKYLGAHIERTLGRKMILWDGYCPTHALINSEHIDLAKKNYPTAPIIVHPECETNVCLAANDVLSTGQMCKFVKSSNSKTIVVGTEIGLLHRLRKENPSKKIESLLATAHCPNMKLTTIEKILWSLEDMKPQIKVTEPTLSRAKTAINRMFEEGSITPLEY